MPKSSWTILEYISSMTGRMRSVKTILKAKRKESGLSYRQLGEKIGVNWTWLCRIEQGKAKFLSFNDVMNICEYFNIDPWSIKR